MQEFGSHVEAATRDLEHPESLPPPHSQIFSSNSDIVLHADACFKASLKKGHLGTAPERHTERSGKETLFLFFFFCSEGEWRRKRRRKIVQSVPQQAACSCRLLHVEFDLMKAMPNPGYYSPWGQRRRDYLVRQAQKMLRGGFFEMENFVLNIPFWLIILWSLLTSGLSSKCCLRGKG